MISKTKTFWQPCLATKGEQRAQKKENHVEMDMMRPNFIQLVALGVLSKCTLNASLTNLKFPRIVQLLFELEIGNWKLINYTN